MSDYPAEWWLRAEFPYAPRQTAHPAPETAIDDAPAVWVRINREWVAHLVGVIGVLAEDNLWTGDDDERYRATQEIERLIDLLSVGVSPMDIGTIIPSVRATMPDNYLLCDGSFYAGSEYPELFALIDDAFKADNLFNVPDLRGRTILGHGGAALGYTDFPLADVGGAEYEMLQYTDLYPHNHADEQSNDITIKVPAAGTDTVVAGPTFSTATGVTPIFDQTAFDTMPPFFVLKYYIVAR